MALMVRVCADLYADKVNLEIICDRAWDMNRVRDTISGVMNAEAELMRPPNAPRIPFHLHRLQMFDDRVLSWVDVAAAEQFFEGAQLYAFQPQTSYHTDVQKGLPPSRPPSARAAPAPLPQAPVQVQAAPVPAAAGAAGVSADGAAVYENGRDGATEEEKVNYLFDEMDAGEQGHLSYPEFSSWLRDLVDFSEETFQLLFRSADAHGQGVVSRELFLHFSRRFPNVCEIVFHRAADRWDVTNRDMEARAASQQVWKTHTYKTHNTTHNTTQHNTTQHNTTQHNTTQHNTTQHNTTQHNTTQHNTTQHNTTQHNTTQHNTTQHNTTQHNTTQHNTTQHNSSRPVPRKRRTSSGRWRRCRSSCSSCRRSWAARAATTKSWRARSR